MVAAAGELQRRPRNGQVPRENLPRAHSSLCSGDAACPRRRPTRSTKAVCGHWPLRGLWELGESCQPPNGPPIFSGNVLRPCRELLAQFNERCDLPTCFYQAARYASPVPRLGGRALSAASALAQGHRDGKGPCSHRCTVTNSGLPFSCPGPGCGGAQNLPGKPLAGEKANAQAAG